MYVSGPTLVVEVVSVGRGLYSNSQWLCLLTTLQIGRPSFTKMPFSPPQKKRWTLLCRKKLGWQGIRRHKLHHTKWSHNPRQWLVEVW